MAKQTFQIVGVTTLGALITIICSGCGIQATNSGPKSSAVAIGTQPASQTVPLGNTATFSVSATGTAPLHYQWYENENPVPGATNSSYTTTAVTAEDTGEKFQVQVGNSISTLTSTQAILTVGPRSPNAGDLRFKEVDTPYEQDQGDPDLTTGNPVGYLQQFNDSTGSPLSLGGDCAAGYAYDCTWQVWITQLPAGQTGMSFYVFSHDYSSFRSDLSNGLLSGYQFSGDTDNVITSLDLEPASLSYAITWVEASDSSGFGMENQVVAPNAVSSTVAADARQSRVVTALSYDDDTGNVNLISYTWQGDTSAIYDTMVLSALPQDVASAAKTLANDGYIITACGGNDHDGFLLVGTKIHGDTMPRSLISGTSSKPLTPSQTAGYAPVAWVFYPVPGTLGKFVKIYEK